MRRTMCIAVLLIAIFAVTAVAGPPNPPGTGTCARMNAGAIWVKQPSGEKFIWFPGGYYRRQQLLPVIADHEVNGAKPFQLPRHPGGVAAGGDDEGLGIVPPGATQPLTGLAIGYACDGARIEDQYISMVGANHGEAGPQELPRERLRLCLIEFAAKRMNVDRE